MAKEKWDKWLRGVTSQLRDAHAIFLGPAASGPLCLFNDKRQHHFQCMPNAFLAADRGCQSDRPRIED